MNRWFRAVGALVLAGALAACGGGGGDDDETPPVNTVPVASAGTDQTVDVGATVSLDGSGSSDADGDSLTYQWSITTPATSAAALSSATAQKPTFVADVAGRYTIRLTVNDGQASSDDTVVVEVNARPVADAGDAVTIDLGATATLDGGASSDPDGDALTYRWTLTTKPAGSAAALSSTTARESALTPDVEGAYVVTLVVNDGRLDSAASTVTVTARVPAPVNRAPVAEAGAAQAVTLGQTARLDGRGSSDADGDRLTYEWSITTRPTGSTAQLSSTSAAQPTLVPDVVGNYVISLVVDDGLLKSPVDTVTVTAALPPSVPAAVARVAADAFAVGSSVTLDGTASSDADGDALTYTWTLGTKPAGSTATIDNRTSATASFTPDVEGLYAANLVVNDGTSDSEPARVTVVAVKVKTIGEEVTDPVSGLKLKVVLSEVSDAGSGLKRYNLNVVERNDTKAPISDKPMAIIFDTGDAAWPKPPTDDDPGFKPLEIAPGGSTTRNYQFVVSADWVPLVWQYDPNTTAPRVDATKLQWLMPIPTP